MKQKLLTKLLLMLLCTLGGASFSPILAEKTETITQEALSLTGSYTSNTEKTINGITYVYTDLMKNSSNIQAKASTGVIYNKTAFPGDITSVAITHSGTARSTTIFGSSDGTNWTQVQTGSGSITVDFSGKGYKYFKITRGANAAYWTKIEINYSNSCATPTFSLADGTYGSAKSVEISTETDGATIHYTTDGSTPTSSSATYSTAISVSTTTTIKAIAVKDGMDDSEVATAIYTIATPCATPTFSVAAGIYDSDQSVTLSTATEDATIYYTTDGTTPSSSSTAYSSAITVSESMTIKAIAVKDGMADSDVASAAYTINKPTPSLSFANASYNGYLGSSFSAPTLTNTNSVSPITYSSSNSSVANVIPATGAISLVGEGSTIITASFAGNASYTAANASYTLNVSDPAVATTVTINNAGITNTDVYVSTTAGSFAATVKDNKDATIAAAAVTWSSSNTDVATIDSSTGAVTLVAKGVTTITATYTGVQYSYLGSSKTYELTVTSSKPITEETFTFSTMGYESGDEVPGVEGEACTLTFAQGSHTTLAPKYYDTDTGARMYSGNTLTISSATKTIESIIFTFASSYETLALADGQPGTLSDASGSKRTWTGSASSIQFTTSATNRIQVIKVIYDNRAVSDLTKTSDVTLDFKGGNTNADLTDYFTTSSTGTITYTVADETIIENADELISALKVGSTTVTVSQAKDATYKAGEITINVTVNDTRTACVTGLDLTSTKTINLDDAGDLTATSTKDGDFTGTINYTYESADPTIFYIDGSEYLGAGVGGTTVTVWATPTGGNAASYSAVSAVVNVKVNGTNSITLDKSSYSAFYGSQADFDINVATPVSYDGTITAVSSNPTVATVSVDGTTVTVAPKAVVGTATISITAGTGTYYSGTDTKTCTVEITAPTGSTEAPTPEIIFNETFSGCDGTGGNSGGWSGSVASKTYLSTMAENSWSMTTAYAADECVRMGTGSSLGKAITPAIALEGGITYTLSFRAGAWSGKSTNLKVSMTNGTLSANSVTMKEGAFDDFELTITNASAGATITFEGNSASNSQFFLDDVKVTKPAVNTATVTLNASGFATYCSVYPLDFSDYTNQDFRAWQVTGIDGSTITFEKITTAIKGGQGVVLSGTAGASITIPMKNSSTVLSSNLLHGTTAPVYFAQDEIYGLSGNAFKPNNGGVINANKAYLLASEIITSGVKSFTFVFMDDEDGIVETKQVSREEVEQIFDLSGRRLQKMQRGINIINGRKVLK